MGSAVIGFFRFWYNFIVGDDWTVAAGVIGALAVTSLLVHRGVAAWWLMPIAVGGAVYLAPARRQRRSLSGPASRQTSLSPPGGYQQTRANGLHWTR